MDLVNNFKVNSTLLKISAALGLMIAGTHSASSQIVVDGVTVHSPAGTLENMGTTDYTPAVNILNNGSFITDGDLSLSTEGRNANGITVNGAGSSATLTSGNLLINTFGDVSTAIEVQSGAVEINGIEANTHGFNANGVFAQGNDSSVNLKNGSINTKSGYSHALHAASNAVVLTDGINVATSGDIAFGIYAKQNGRISFLNGNVATEGDNSDGAHVASGATLNIDRATIETQGLLSGGVRNDSSTATVQRSKITTRGDGAYGLDAINAGSVLNADSVSVTTFGNMEPTGTTSSAVVAEFGGVINLIGESTINTSGANGIGLLSQVSGSGLPDTVINAGDGSSLLSINTTGASGFGIEACSLHGEGLECANSLQDNIGTADTATSSKAMVNVNKATVTTSGQNAYGLYAVSQDAKIDASGLTVNTSGESAHAIAILRGGEIAIADSQIEAHGDQADGARIVGGSLNGHTASLSLNNSTLKSDSGSGVYAELGDSAVSLDRSRLSGKDAAIVTASTGSMSFSATNGSEIQGNVDASGSLDIALNSSTLNGDIISRLGNTNFDALSVSAANGSTVTGSMTDVSATSLSNSQWNMTASSTITGLSGQPTSGLQLDNGYVNLVSDGQNYKTLTVSALSGSGTFALNTELNDGGSNTRSDLLHVTGKASGSYLLIVNNTVGAGAQTVEDGIRVAQLDGDSVGTAVALGRPVTAGEYEYLLYQGGESDANDWYLRSQLASPSPTPSQSYNPSVPGYVIGPYLNRMYGFDTIGTLHERVGDQENLRKNQEFNQGVWGRIHGGQTKSYKDRFTYDAETWFAQFGGDLYQSYGESGARTHAGVIATLGQVTANAKDALRPLYKGRSEKTGSVNSRGYGVGAYYTRYAANSAYIDTVAQYTHYHNSYNSVYGDDASQGGDGVTLSVEVGKPFKNANGWFIEPQAQIMYQYLHLDAMNDGVAAVSSTSDNSGLARLGARAGYDSAATSNIHPYVTADVISVIGRSPDVTVSGTTFNQNYSSQWGEVGGGVTGDMTKNVTFYTTLKYKQGFDGDMHGVTGDVGLRINW
ncbi:autotransporter [Leminorella grimontii]|nr:autotransporter [Leminorella grimontii]